MENHHIVDDLDSRTSNLFVGEIIESHQEDESNYQAEANMYKNLNQIQDKEMVYLKQHNKILSQLQKKSIESLHSLESDYADLQFEHKQTLQKKASDKKSINELRKQVNALQLENAEQADKIIELQFSLNKRQSQKIVDQIIPNSACFENENAKLLNDLKKLQKQLDLCELLIKRDEEIINGLENDLTEANRARIEAEDRVEYVEVPVITSDQCRHSNKNSFWHELSENDKLDFAVRSKDLRSSTPMKTALDESGIGIDSGVSNDFTGAIDEDEKKVKAKLKKKSKLNALTRKQMEAEMEISNEIKSYESIKLSDAMESSEVISETEPIVEGENILYPYRKKPICEDVFVSCKKSKSKRKRSLLGSNEAAGQVQFNKRASN